MTIKHILFDADGVLQYATVHWQPALKSALRLEDDAQAEAVLADIFEAETEVLESQTGFIERLEARLGKWGRAGLVVEALAVLHAIEVHADVMQTVQCLRRAGFQCHIGSNQQTLRAKHMSEALNYRALFDREFYSCHLGAAKPKLEFFEKTVAELGCDANKVLFLDDRAENVEAAKRAGLSAMVYFGTEGAASLRHHLAGFGVFAAH